MESRGRVNQALDIIFLLWVFKIQILAKTNNKGDKWKIKLILWRFLTTMLQTASVCQTGLTLVTPLVLLINQFV